MFHIDAYYIIFQEKIHNNMQRVRVIVFSHINIY